MPQATTYRIHPRAALHVGARGVGQEETSVYVPSDTLFSALLSTWVMMGGSAEDWMADFQSGDAPFLLTSAFPFAGGVRFYPMPRVTLDFGTEGGPLDLKRLRDVEFVSEEVFRHILAGRRPLDIFPSAPEGNGLFMQGGTLWLTREEMQRLPERMRFFPTPQGGRAPRPQTALNRLSVWKADKVPRVTVDRISQGSNIYHTGRVLFAPECGLWFGVSWRHPERSVTADEVWRDVLARTMSVMADSGIGAERTYGFGAFCWDTDGTQEWADTRSGQPFVTLSRYHPRSEETPAVFEGNNVRYHLTAVAGYLSTPSAPAQRRRRIWLVSEGSSLTSGDAAVAGQIIDVSPSDGSIPHKVWRYGLAFPVGLEVRDA